MLLSLFREATCPFCNFRVYELTQCYPHLTRHGLDVVTVFSSPEDEVNRFIARRPRPVRMVADPLAEAHRRFALRSSFRGKMQAMMLRPLALLFDMREIGMRAMLTNSLLGREQPRMLQDQTKGKLTGQLILVPVAMSPWPACQDLVRLALLLCYE